VNTILWHIRRHPLLALVLSMTFVLAIVSWVFADRQIVVNTSPSVPSGLYLRSDEPPCVGALIDFRIPEAARRYVQIRTRQDGINWYILKPVVAGPGDYVDTTGDWLVINDRRVAPMPPPQDTQGFALPAWREARVLGSDEFFVFSERIANSFDSRCYGPIRREQIDAVRRPLVTW
jgi:conjugative transfer signal peptidase TraF